MLRSEWIVFLLGGLNLICKFNDVTERDMDMLFLEEFAYSNCFLEMFLDKIGISDVELLEIEHSKTDTELGESDMTVIMKCRDSRIAFLIEDKIDAVSMPKQYERYVQRGERGIQNGDYNSFYVFMIAPLKYLTENSEAKKYPYHVTYEECLDYFACVNDDRALFKIQQIQCALDKQKNGYQVIESEAATTFWRQYVTYQKTYFPQLLITNHDGKKGARMKWVYYAVPVDGIHLIHKTEKGFVDLEFAGAGESINLLRERLHVIIGDLKSYGADIFKTGKSAVLRVQVPPIHFLTDFEKEHEKIKCCLMGVEKLVEISYKIQKSQ